MTPVAQTANASRSDSGVLFWPHWQRVWARWLRLWGFAGLGFLLGAWLVWWHHEQASQDAAQVAQEVQALHQQLRALPEALPAPTALALSSAQKDLLGRLPNPSQQEAFAAELQQMLVGHGLRVTSLRPVPGPVGEKPGSDLPNQAYALRLQGPFQAWSGLWSRITQLGPMLTIERISMVATDTPGDVQIDALLRVWMRAPELGHSSWPEPQSGWPNGAAADRPSSRMAAPLFALARETPLPMLSPSLADGHPQGALANEADHAVVSDAPWSQDPHQWPLARVRLLGLWQQGGERHAVLSAGPHWVHAAHGQRVTLEGHRVVAISDQGVGLQLAQGPVVELLLDAGPPSGPSKRPSSGPSKGPPKGSFK